MSTRGLRWLKSGGQRREGEGVSQRKDSGDLHASPFEAVAERPPAQAHGATPRGWAVTKCEETASSRETLSEGIARAPPRMGGVRGLGSQRGEITLNAVVFLYTVNGQL